jgi:hypothetical protein
LQAKPLPRTTSSIGNGKAPQSPTALARKAEASATADRYIAKDGGPPVPYKETIAAAAGKSDIEYEAERRDMARDASVRVSALDRERDLARDSESAAIAAVSEEVMAELERQYAESAKSIIACDDILELLMKETRKVIAGEERNVKLLYLATTSRLFGKPMNVVIKGPSSAGKSEIRERLLTFLPPESVITFTSMSEKALIFDDRGFENKILSMAEAVSIEERGMQDMFLRELMSAGKITYTTTIRRGSNCRTFTITKTGPVSFLVTTTKDKLHLENETRMLSIEVDSGEEQTAAVIDKVMQIEGLNAADTAVDVEPWRDFQRWLEIGNTAVVVPFARELGRLMPKDTVRARRDAAQVLAAIKAHALLHREHRDLDERGQIVADIKRDYATVHELLNGIIDAGTKIPKATLETLEAVREAGRGATAKRVGELLGLDTSAARRRLLDAAEAGLVVNEEVKRRQPGRYRVIEQKGVLPVPAELQKILPSCHPKQKVFTEQ